MFKFIQKLVSPFSKMKSALGQKLRSLFSRKIDPSSFDELERIFYEADLGSKMAKDLVNFVKEYAKKHPDPTSFVPAVKEELLRLFSPPPSPSTHAPHVILIVGVNGSGKTTTLAKLAYHFQKMGKSVLIAAADTFRAAAVEQLETWAKRVNVPLIKSKPNSDPSAVAFDALSSAKAKSIDIVLIDTAGRLQNKADLMQELAKVRRVCQKQIPDSPHETLLILDATMGQNALDAARTFHQFTPITGIVLTKLDGSAKGGIAIAIQKELGLPIQWVGLGEKEGDLAPFDSKQYIDALFE